ncbi:initiator tRNA phosphoribosyl transferase-domain-containing protein [Russula vinacea]|nr:initiator tRNA phosphoribosyl transferase-domain-containing protein [Russula vinacea]
MARTLESSARAHIRRESLDIYNRLHSIQADIAFVNEVRAAYPSFPLIPNLRCGAWYTDPAIVHFSSSSAYDPLRDTDGHHGNWSFNLRRPNIHLLSIAATHGGLIVVDSTRAGKRLPDALSKPCRSDISAADPGLNVDVDVDLRTPPGAVSPHEHAQIARGSTDSSYALPPELARPLRPLWITPASARFPDVVAPDASSSFLPVICVSASRAVDTGTERRAGDSHMCKGREMIMNCGARYGLTPQLFWRHRAELLACSREELDAVVVNCAPPTPVLKVGGRVLLCTLADLPRELPAGVPSGTCEPANDGETETAFIVVHASNAPRVDIDNTRPKEPPRSDNGETQPGPAPGESGGGTSRVLRMHVPSGRRAQQQQQQLYIFVHEVLPRAVSFASLHLGLGRKIHGIGVALVLLQLFFDDEGRLRGDDVPGAAATKRSVRTRLEWIIASQPRVNPSRAILKRVNDFLLSSRSHSHSHSHGQDGA